MWVRITYVTKKSSKDYKPRHQICIEKSILVDMNA